MKIPRLLGVAALSAVGILWVLGVAIPLGTVFVRARDLSLLWESSVLAVVRVTAKQAFLSAAISAVIGLPLGLWIGSRARAANRWAQTLLAIPSGVPSVVAAFSWVAWLGRSGWLARAGIPLDWSYSLKAVILAHVFFNAPWIALLVAQARARVPEREIEAARTLGAGNGSVVKQILWPHVRFAFLAATAQALAFCVMSFAIVMILGGGPPVQTLETALYSRIRFGSLDLSGALACGIWELALTLVPWAFVLYFQSREALIAPASRPSWREQKVGSSLGMLLLCAIFVLPYFAVFVGARGLFSEEIRTSLELSLRLALSTGVGATAAACLSVLALATLPRASRGLASVLLLLPGGISAMVLGLGLWLAYGRFIDPFAGSFKAMFFLQTALFFPIAFRILWPVAQEFPRRLFESALTMGASPWTAFRLIDWPRWRVPVVSALAIVAAASLGEVAAVSLFYSEKLIPLPLLVSRWMSQYRFEEAQGVASLLFFLSALTLILVSRTLRGANQRPI